MRNFDTPDTCPEDCGGIMEEVDGEIEPARQADGDTKDAVFGTWMECNKCGEQIDIEQYEY